MALFRSLLLPIILATSIAVGLSGVYADDVTKTSMPVPPLPDKSKDKPVPAAFSKANPENIDDLKAIEKHVKDILDKVIPCTVGIRVGGSSGSGVIVSADGLVLTAAHVSVAPNRDISIIMPDGKTHKGKTLGGFAAIDSGMVKITDEGKWPFVEMGKSADMKKGDWCIVTGQPGGFKQGRSPVVRVGRVLEVNYTRTDKFIRTDCTLVGGDSGGPLFDLQGRVIGIHSRIGTTLAQNMHVPVDTYRETWDRLVKGDREDGRIGGGGGGGRGGRGTPTPPAVEPEFGFKLDQSAKSCKVSEILKDSPADKAGLKSGDVIKKFDGKEATTVAALLDDLKKKKPGDEVTIEILRDNKPLTLKVVAGKKS